MEGCSKTLSVVSTAVNKKTLKLSVFAPAAGKVTASGKGVSSGSKSYSGVEAAKQDRKGDLQTLEIPRPEKLQPSRQNCDALTKTVMPSNCKSSGGAGISLVASPRDGGEVAGVV